MSSWTEKQQQRLSGLRTARSMSDAEQEELIALEMAYADYLRDHPEAAAAAAAAKQQLLHQQQMQAAPVPPATTATTTSTNGDSNKPKNKKTTSSSNGGKNDDDDDLSEADATAIAVACKAQDEAAAAAAASGGGGGFFGYASSLGSALSSYVPDSESVAKLKEVGWFWGASVAGTALPSIIGTKLGLVDKHDHWSWIETPTQQKTGGLILGALPVVTEFQGMGNHLKGALKQQLAERGTTMGLVVSAMTADEMDGFGGPIQFATHAEWKKEYPQVETMQFSMRDCTSDGATFENMCEVVDKMEQTIRAGKTVYCHCRAGKGRSFVTTLCFLMKHRGMSMDAANTLIRAVRPQVNPSAQQMEFVQHFADQLKKQRHQNDQS